MSITKIVLTGGPCGGKSTGLSRIEQELTDRGYKVYIIAETATELITGGIIPGEVGVMPFQNAVLRLQKRKEEVYLEQAKRIEDKKVVILFDRGIMDARAFMSKEEFKELLKQNNLKEIELKDYYDGVFHLKTAADGAEEFYTFENNKARTEGIEEARKIDKKTIKAWTGHQHLRVIDNSTGFDEKMDRLLIEIFSLLGEPIPTEIERKYLIEIPNLKELKEKYQYTKVGIIQTYLVTNDEDTEVRIRQRGVDGVYSYYLTKKKSIDTEGLKRMEIERKITQEEYLRYLMEADTSLKQIRKDRYCFVYNNSYLELDIYPFWKDKAILEIELTSEDEVVNIPDCIKVIKEVTDDIRYKNHSLARTVKGL